VQFRTTSGGRNGLVTVSIGLGDLVADRYQLIEPLGRGGMGRFTAAWMNCSTARSPSS